MISPIISMAFPPHSFMFQAHEDHQDHLPSLCPPKHFQGGEASMLKRSMSFSGFENKCELEVRGDDELSDDGCQLGEKKKRLNLEQVKALEKCFELGNKIEPERKMQLAKALGLQPRQIAIWFQNRRARWKTKQLEKDYQVLKKQFEALKTDNDTLQSQNKKLHAQLLALKGRANGEAGKLITLKKATEGSWISGSDNSSDINLDISRTPVITNPVSSQSGKKLLPSSLRPSSITQLFQPSSRPDLHTLKLDHMVQDENFCNMFNGIDEQQNFWPWPEQHQFR